MNGTVLNITNGSGIILDNDGNRYSFGQNDVKSPSLRNGSKVNFVAEENMAKEIYSLSGGNPFGSMGDSLSQGATNLTGGSEVKTSAYIAAAGAFLSLFGVFAAFLAFVGFGLELYGVYRLAVYKNEMSFFWYKVKAVVAGLIATLLFTWAASYFLLFGLSLGIFTSLGIGGVLMILLGTAAAIYAVMAMFNALRGIADAYNANLFNIAAWLFLAALMTMAFGIGVFLMAIYSILLIVAYVTIQDTAMLTTTVNTPTPPQPMPVYEPVKKEEETIACPQCQGGNLVKAKFCTHCGASLINEVIVQEIIEPKCTICGKIYTDGSKFCEEDGGKIV